MTATALLEVRNLTKSFASLHVLKGLDLACPRGEVVALIGRNGSGKSTLLNCISGRVQSTGGSITLDGVALPHERSWKRAQRGIGWTFQDVGMPLTLTPAELLGLAADRPNAAACECVDGELEAEARRFRDRPWSSLSFGQRKLIGILVATTSRPRLLLLDEPVAGLSPRIVPLVTRHLKQLAAAGMAILLVEHNRQFVTETAGRLHLLSAGTIAKSGTPDDVFSASVTLEALL